MALSSVSIWRRVRLFARRPDHLVSHPPLPGELHLPFHNDLWPTEDELLDFFPPTMPIFEENLIDGKDINSIDLKFLGLRKHQFELPFDSVFEALITRGSAAGEM